MDLAVTPNPSRSTVVAHITGGSATPPRVTLHAMSGELIDTRPSVARTTDGWRVEVDLSSCASGTYVLTTFGTEGSRTGLIRHIANGS